jgi:hypothetical protein
MPPNPPPTTPYATQYEPLSPDERSQVLKETKRLLSDPRTAPKKRKPPQPET